MYYISKISGKIYKKDKATIVPKDQNKKAYKEYLTWLKVNNELHFFDGTEVEQKAQEQKETLDLVKHFISKKKTDGKILFENFELKITHALLKQPKAFAKDLLSEIDNVLYKPLSLIKTGDYASALLILQATPPPKEEFVLTFWEELKTTVTTYYKTEYKML